MKYGFTSLNNDPLVAAVNAVLSIDEASGADPAKLKSIITNHSALLKKATNAEAKKFHQTAIANAKEKLQHLGEELEEGTLDNELREAEDAISDLIIKFNPARSAWAQNVIKLDPATNKPHVHKAYSLLRDAEGEVSSIILKSIAKGLKSESVKSLEEGLADSLGFKNITRDIAGLAARLNANSSIAKAVMASAGPGYKDDFVKMQKAMQTIEDIWDDIVKDVTIGQQSDS